MQKCILIIGLLIGFTFAAVAQKPIMTVTKSKADSAQAKRDSLNSKPFNPKITTERIYHPDSNHSPHKAVMRSLMVPGLGQLYNHQWWKVPVIYAGLGLIGWAYVFNQNYYKETLAIARYAQRGTAPNPGDKYYNQYQQYKAYGYLTNTTAIDDAVRGYERYRDISIIGFVGAWGINLVDAYIESKFQHSYTMDSNLTMKITPGIINQPGGMYAGNLNSPIIPGIKLTFTLQ